MRFSGLAYLLWITIGKSLLIIIIIINNFNYLRTVAHSAS